MKKEQQQQQRFASVANRPNPQLFFRCNSTPSVMD
jgi:hypothetical protein